MRPQILKLNGMSLCDFADTNAALTTADELIKRNLADFNHSGQVEEHPNPLLARYFYIENLGKKRTWSQSENKKLGGDAPLKNPKQAVTDNLMMEALGAGMVDTLALPQSSNVKIESVAFSHLTQHKASLKSNQLNDLSVHPAKEVNVISTS